MGSPLFADVPCKTVCIIRAAGEKVKKTRQNLHSTVGQVGIFGQKQGRRTVRRPCWSYFMNLSMAVAEILQRLFVALLHRVDDAVADVILQDHLAHVVDGALTAAICTSTSLQSRPSSTMRRMDSMWPMIRAMRFNTALVFSWVWVWPWPWLWAMPSWCSSSWVCCF